jgi:hypothetical protein
MMSTKKLKIDDYTVFDTGEEFIDRYTVIYPSGDMLALSEFGVGVNQYAGNCVDNYMFHAFGAAWRRHCDVDKVIKNKLPEIIEAFKSEGNIGVEVDFYDLPQVLQKTIQDRWNQDQFIR